MKDIDARLERLEQAVLNSRTSKQYETRKKILGRIKEYLEHSGDDDLNFYANLVEDWPAFVAWELDTEEGVPVFLSRWQIRADRQADENSNVWVCCSRQIGKTVWEATRALKHMMLEDNCRVLGIAPTTDQLVVRDNLRHFIQNSDFIMEHFVKPKQGGCVEKEKIIFAATGSKFEPMNMSGDHKRGPSADIIMIDEFQLLSEDDWSSIVQPMLTAAFTEKKLYRFMTPSELHRPNLSAEWERAVASDEVLTVNVNVWQALDQGIKKPVGEDPGTIQSIFRDKNIKCPFVEKVGACPGFLPDWFGDDVPSKCMGCFEGHDKFIREHMGVFPEKKERFFRTGWLHEARSEEKHLSWDGIRELDGKLSVGIDLGGLQDPTVCVVNQFWRDSAGSINLRTVGHYKIPSAADNKNIDDKEIVSRLKKFLNSIKPDAIYMDVTRKDQIAEQIVSGENAVPRSLFYTTSGAEKNDIPGIWISNQVKHDFYSNHQGVLMNNRLEVRGPEDWWQEYYEEHMAVRQNVTRATYPKYDTPRTDHLLDAAVYASGPALETVKDEALHEFEFIE